MKRVAALTRLLVFATGLFLLVPSLRRSPAQGAPQGARAQATFAPLGQPGDCIYAMDQPNTPCPSGCTTSTFTQWVAKPGTNGTDYLEANGTAPCGTAKQGQQCSPPTLWNPKNDYQNCCTKSEGGGCTGNYNVLEYLACCDPSPVVCMSGTCCIGNGGSCSPSNPDVCCTRLCLTYNNECGTCSDLGGPCGNSSDCCYYDGIACPSGECCIEKGGPCANDSDCCTGWCAPCGMCEYQ
jgi:hypothetical protein